MRQPVLLAAAIAAFGICASVTACSVRADAPEYRPSDALAHWFESLDRPDFDASVDSVISCCDAGDAYPIVILQEATIGGGQLDGIAEVTDPGPRTVIKPNGEKKYRQPWAGPLRFAFPGKKVTREIKGNPTSTAWVFATTYTGVPMIYCVVMLPPGV